MTGRRFATVPGYVLAWFLWISCAPLWIPLCVIVDVVRMSRGVAIRSGVLVAIYLSCEVLGILASGILWLRNLIWRCDDERWIDLHFRLEAWWGNALFSSLCVLFGLKVEVEGATELEQGPYLLLARHASAGDTLLASQFASTRFGMRLRYVLKKELLWDPCLDIVGNRIPNAFVDRDSNNSGEQVKRVAKLAIGLGPRDGVLIFPEGSRFTQEKRLRTIERFRRKGKSRMHEYATNLSHVLSPRTGGVLSLFEVAPDLDVIVCSHTGFEGAGSISQVWNGALLNNTIHIEYRRIDRSDIPSDRDAQERWLLDQWTNVNAYVKGHSPQGELS